VHKRFDLLVHTGRSFSCTRIIELACDAKMVSHTIVISCLVRNMFTVKLCVEYALAHGCILLLLLF